MASYEITASTIKPDEKMPGDIRLIRDEKTRRRHTHLADRVYRTVHHPVRVVRILDPRESLDRLHER